MNRVAWPALMRLGMVELGLAPTTFWNLTPAELFLLAGVAPPERALGRSGLTTLMAQFPDAPRGAD